MDICVKMVIEKMTGFILSRAVDMSSAILHFYLKLHHVVCIKSEKSKCDMTQYNLTKIIIFFVNQNKIEQSQRPEEHVPHTFSPDLLLGLGGDQCRHRG